MFDTYSNMQNEQYIVSLIEAVLGIKPYPITAPSDAALPFIIWNMSAGEEQADLAGPSGFRDETYTFTIVAHTYDDVVAVREDLRTLLQNSSPLMFVNDGEMPIYDSSEYPNLYVQNVIYNGLLPTTQIVSPQVLSASYAATCSFLTGTIESASYSKTASFLDGVIASASFAATAAYALNTPTLPDGLVSSSQQIDYTLIQNKPTSIESASYAATASYALNTPTLPEGLVSSSAQVFDNSGVYSSSAQLPVGLVSSSAQVLDGTGIVSGSTIATASYVKNAVSASYIKSSNVSYSDSGIVSGSSQIDYTGIQNKPTSIATASYALTASYVQSGAGLPAGVVSSSAQVVSSLAGQNVTVNALTASLRIYAPNSASMFAQVRTITLDNNIPEDHKIDIPLGSMYLNNGWIYGNLRGSASLALTASYVDYSNVQNKPTTIATASYVQNAQSASYFQLPVGTVSSSAQILTGSNIYSSSAQLPSGIVSGSSQIVNWSVLSSSYAVSASWAPQSTVPETSSYALQALSASWAPSQPAVSASYAATASTWNGYNVWVGTTAQYNALSGSYDAATLYFVKA